MAETVTDVSCSQVMTGVMSWLERRSYTIGLILFFTAWYGFQLFVVHMIGVEAAKKWFYFTPDLGTGWLVAPFSHNMQNIGDLVGYLTTLSLVGSFIEPHLKKRQYMEVFLGILVFSIFAPVIGTVLFVDGEWLVAGASGGVYGLWVFAAVYRSNVVRNWREWIDVDEWDDLRYWIECMMLLFGFSLLIVVPVADVYSRGSANAFSHISGMIFGMVLGLELRT